MAKGYWMARVDVADAERYKDYVAANAAAFAKYGARFLVRGGRFENPEGGARQRNATASKCAKKKTTKDRQNDA